MQYIGSTGQVMLTSTKISLLRQPKLSLVNNESISIQKTPLVNCNDALFAYMFFPRGEYTYLLTGEDTAGIPISYHIKSKVFFIEGEYNLTISSDSIEIELFHVFSFNFSLSSQDFFYPTRFNVSMDANGFNGIVEPKSVLIQPKETVNVSVTFWISSFSIRGGSSSVITVEASNGCATLTGTKTVMIKV